METFVPQTILQELTSRVRYSAQYRVLCQMGFHAIKAPSGEPKVTWQNFSLVTGGNKDEPRRNQVVLHPEDL